MKKYTSIFLIVLVITLGYFTGNYIYKIKKISNTKSQEIAELVEDECTYLGEIAYNDSLISASTSMEKTSPKCTIVFKLYYEQCGHILEKKETIKQEDVNLTEEELKKRFPEWELQKFTPTEIVLYKELDDFCNEHYLLKEKDGNIAIFSLDQNNGETFLETTDISVAYLEQEDLDKIKNGIIINSKKELNKTLEDFE